MWCEHVVDIELRWAEGFAPLRPSPAARRRGEVVALWYCPVCAHPTHRRHGPGRPKVYCSNACRQRAYRWRCDHHHRLGPTPSSGSPAPTGQGEPAEPTAPVERAATRGRVHAVRRPGDPVGTRRTTADRGVTACGTFARVAADTPHRFAHTKLIPSERTCARCRLLLGLHPVPAAEALERAARYAGRSG